MLKPTCFSISMFWHSASPDKIVFIDFWIAIFSVPPQPDRTLLTAVPHASCANGPSKSVFHAWALWLYKGELTSLKLHQGLQCFTSNLFKTHPAWNSNFWYFLITVNFTHPINSFCNWHFIMVLIDYEFSRYNFFCSFSQKLHLFDSYRGCKF